MMLQEIYEYVNDVLNIDIKENTRQREYAEGRALFYKLSQEITGNSLSNIGRYMGKSHATVLHGIKNIFPIIDRNIIVKAYDNFGNTESLPSDFFTSLQRENSKLKSEIESHKNWIKQKTTELDAVLLLFKGLTEDQLFEVSERIEPIVHMVKTKKVWKPKNIQLEGAIK